LLKLTVCVFLFILRKAFPKKPEDPDIQIDNGIFIYKLVLRLSF
jgi:hypothetical protein